MISSKDLWFEEQYVPAPEEEEQNFIQHMKEDGKIGSIVASNQSPSRGDLSHLLYLLENTSFEHTDKDGYSAYIENITDWDDYNTVRDCLLMHEVSPRDRIRNGQPYNQSDINKAVRVSK